MWWSLTITPQLLSTRTRTYVLTPATSKYWQITGWTVDTYSAHAQHLTLDICITSMCITIFVDATTAKRFTVSGQPDVIATGATVWRVCLKEPIQAADLICLQSKHSPVFTASWLSSYTKTDNTIVRLSQIQSISILFSPLLSLYFVNSAGITSESLESHVSLSDTMTHYVWQRLHKSEFFSLKWIINFLRTQQVFCANFTGANCTVRPYCLPWQLQCQY